MGLYLGLDYLIKTDLWMALSTDLYSVMVLLIVMVVEIDLYYLMFVWMSPYSVMD